MAESQNNTQQENIFASKSNCTLFVEKKIISLLLILPITLTGCLSTKYKIPEAKEDYAYYGLEYKDAIDAIKYCRSNQDIIS